jgi:hypothetical protein
MFKSSRKHLGIQVLEYGLLGAIIVGGGAYAVSKLGNGSVDKQAQVTACIDTTGADATGKSSAGNCVTN